MSISELLRLPAGPVDLGAIDTNGQPGFDGDKADGKEELPLLGDPLEELQEKLYAEGYTGSTRRILLVLQGMDTAGKGGVVNKTVGLLSPSGLRLKSFKKPTPEELEHDFLWRVDREAPRPGEIAIFDRSHYEDVLVARVRALAEPAEIERRYDAINDWERGLVEQGTVIIKCMLHISAHEQKERLLARLDEPTKQWKFHPSDVDERELWPAYQAAYTLALERCNTEHAPWYVVPSDKKWYRNWAVGSLLHEALSGLGLTWPGPDYDVEEQRRRLTEEDRIS